MAYYHIIIETNDKVGKTPEFEKLYEFDKVNIEEIKTNYIEPYLNGNDFHFKGYIIQKSKIRRFAIKETDNTIESIRDREQKKITGMILFFYTKEMIVEDDKFVKDITHDMLNSVKTSSKPPINSKHKIDMDKIFIVHGHDDSMKLDVARFIEKLGFEAIILHEQANSGLTIIEKIEKYSNVGYAIVLYSPCDVGSENKPEVKPRLRARQNVVFEHGYLIGKIGRDHVSALVKDDIETPGDISGVIYIPYLNKNWKFDIANELREVGYTVDMNKI